MSKALYGLGGLPFWTAHEILIRDQIIFRIQEVVQDALLDLNAAWRFERIEGPLLTPRKYIAPEYDGKDIFLIENDKALRPETTASSYLYAEHLMKSGKAKAPLCIFQAGKSFRQELSDGATAAKLRLNEFYQLEFQCIYSTGTKADYRRAVIDPLRKVIEQITRAKTQYALSDRQPSYSAITEDINAQHFKKDGSFEWREVASVSSRTDFPDEKYLVLEIALGLDRLVLLADNDHADQHKNNGTEETPPKEETNS